MDAPIVAGLLREPRVEDRGHGQPQLLDRILGESLARARLDEPLELRHEGLERLGPQVGIGPGPRLGLGAIEKLVEGVAVDAEDHVTEDGDEAAIAVPGEALVLGPAREPQHRPVIETEVEDSIHHARHGGAGARAHGDEKGPRGGERVRQAPAPRAPPGACAPPPSTPPRPRS